MILKNLLQEQTKKEKPKKIVFVETDPKTPFPLDTISALQKEINKGAKDLTKSWKSATELVDYAFTELEIPKPLAYLNKRWNQYVDLLSFSVNKLKNARGMKGNWTRTI